MQQTQPREEIGSYKAGLAVQRDPELLEGLDVFAREMQSHAIVTAQFSGIVTCGERARIGLGGYTVFATLLRSRRLSKVVFGLGQRG